MSDDVCGPSGALKSFGRHVNQDQSRHQDRARPAPGASQANFRSTPAGPSNEAEFRAFASGSNLILQPGSELIDPRLTSQDMATFRPGMHHPQMGFASPGPVTPVGMPTAGPVTMPIAGPVAGQMQGFHRPPVAQAAGNWAQEFSAMNNQSQVYPSSASHLAEPYVVQHAPQPHMQHAAFGPGQAFRPMMQAYPGVVNYQQPAFQQPTFQQPAFQPMPAFAAASNQNAAFQARVVMAAPVTGSNLIGGLTEAELDARFAQLESDFEFANEMDAWMAEYGPTPAERGQTATTAHQEENVDEILEQLAEELEAQKLAEAATVGAAIATQTSQNTLPEFMGEEHTRAHNNELRQEQLTQALEQEEESSPTQEQIEQDDLARTAEQIVNTLDAHPNERYRESAFVGLMRRIQAREVTVQGDVLVDSTTGLPVESAVLAAEHSDTGAGIPIPPAGSQQEVA
ncbi:hypothetical protein CMQ_4146 [Grosmannia clavigera kw1407]|uniref:Peroxin 20 n=1 Tax=Grosmannia clavigera (strain kw1407 / UAMH 11150) TaxID=655863 RepID=F0X9L6_GROCL|nr:uncharacterized protein CMQ_4146 [Grosmannia clavigera kw1407]EFX06077.1 hypothetical protein CMQ_4146 [Grosmannia clavigera kw1407]